MASDVSIPINKGALINISQIIKIIMSSVVEAKLGTLFINRKLAIVINQTFKD